jgi:hypothetical protein
MGGRSAWEKEIDADDQARVSGDDRGDRHL